MAVLAAGAVAYVEDPFGSHCQLLGGSFELLLLILVAFALPGDESPTFLE